jgi:hypothetical protein
MNKHTAFSTKEDRSHHHLDEIRSCSASRLKTKKQECPKPKSFSDLIVYWVHFFYSHRKPKPSGYWRYVIGVYKNLFLGFYFNWIMIFTSPMSSIAFVLVYPIISSLLFTFEIILKIFMDFLGGAKLVKRISQHHGQGD